MHRLFSPIRLGQLRLPNRLALNALPSSLATPDGIFTPALAAYYTQRARCGVGLVVIEPAFVLPPRDNMIAHVGLYADMQVLALTQCLSGVRELGAGALVMLDQPLWLAHVADQELHAVAGAFVAAAQRARSAGADGVMFSTADGGPFEQLISPLQNQRSGRYGGPIGGRLQLLLEVITAIVRHSGPHFVIGVRLNVEEFAPGGLDLQEARLIATMLASSGVTLLEISATKPHEALVAQFPGWQIPLAEGIKAVVDIPVMVGGQLDDPVLADSVIRDRSADLVAIGERLKLDPYWPVMARAALR